MKQFKLIALAAALLAAVPVSAYDFEVDGIYYNLVSAGDLTCSVTNGDVKYKGNLVIPSTVNYSGKTLTIVRIVASAFSGCSDLTGITIPNTIASIGDNAFWNCSKLERVVFEDGETTLSLGYNSNGKGSWNGEDKPLFCKCPLTSLYIGRTLSYNSDYDHGYSPFRRQHALKELIIGDLVTSIEDWAFHYCDALTNVKIPDSVITIGEYAFSECTGLKNIIIGNSVTKIGGHAFSHCSSLTEVTIPNSVTKIGNYVFENCRNLTEVTLGSSVANIGGRLFDLQCPAVTTLYSLNPIPPKISSFSNAHYMTLNVFVPEEALEAYQNAAVWKEFWNLHGIAGTSIDKVNAYTENSNVYYDLRGNRLDSPKRGINIINGKKVMVK